MNTLARQCSSIVGWGGEGTSHFRRVAQVSGLVYSVADFVYRVHGLLDMVWQEEVEKKGVAFEGLH